MDHSLYLIYVLFILYIKLGASLLIILGKFVKILSKNPNSTGKMSKLLGRMS